MSIRSITPFLWYDSRAEEAADFYCSVFANSRITQVSHYPEGGPWPKGSVMVVAFELDGLPLTALNGGAMQKLTDAFSLSVGCTEQADVDRLWEVLGAGGAHSMCGWLKDKYGLSWQVNYAGMADLMTGDPKRVERVFAAMMNMTKIDIAALKRAAAP